MDVVGSLAVSTMLVGFVGVALVVMVFLVYGLIAIVVICVIALAAAVMLYPPQDKITQGLDIQGGVSVNLSASTLDGSAVTQEQMDEAQSVITSRVNASGASAASVQQQG